MKRVKYYNQTRPSETQLNWGENSKVDNIRQRLRSSAQMGIAWGFQVAVNSLDNTKIDIARGEGYSGGIYLVNAFEGTGSSERISTYTDSPSGSDDIGPAANGLGLADYTFGVKNYVSLVYSEVESYALAERTFPFTSHLTVVTEAFTPSVLTEADWNSLSSNDINNRILVSIVTGRGAGVALTASDIDQFVQPKTLPTTTQPGTLTGILVNALADTTPLGTGTFRWESTLHKLYWTAPGDVEGAGITITDSAVYTLYSNNPNYWIRISVVYGTLTVFGDTSDSVTVHSLYGRTIPMFCSVDQAHRDMVGSGIPTSINPHGMSLDDISGGGYDHADLFHRNGISYDAEPTQLQVSVAASPDELSIVNIGTYRNTFLTDGVSRSILNGYTAGIPGIISFDVLPVPDTGEYLVYVDSAGNLHTLLIGEPLWDADIKVVDMENTTAGDGTISFVYNGFAPNGSYLTWQAPGDVVGASVRIVSFGTPAVPVYYKLYSGDETNWVIVRLTGTLGNLNNFTTFTTDKNITTYPDEIMQKLACVSWSSVTRQFTDVRDIRSFMTADDKVVSLEEHDVQGKHTKVLQNTFAVGVVGNTAMRVEAANTAISAWADTVRAVYAQASAYGIYGSVSANTAIYGTALSYALYGSASDSFGVYGRAKNFGIYGTANGDLFGDVVGVFGTAVNAGGLAIGVEGVAAAANQRGVAGYGALGTGVYGSGVVGVYGYAPNKYGVYGIAAVSAGVYGEAPVRGVEASAVSTALYAYAAGAIAVHARAVGNTVIYAQAAAEGVVVEVAGNEAVLGIADGNVGVYGEGANTGVYGNAGNSGVFGGAASNYGVYGLANGSYGVFGSALSNWGVYGRVGASGATAAVGRATHNTFGTGVYGEAQLGDGTTAGAVGVFGIAGDSGYGVVGVGGESAKGVYGIAGAHGVGVYGHGSFYALFGQGSAVGIGLNWDVAGVAMKFVGAASNAGGMVTQSAIPVSYGAETFYIMLWS